MAPFSDGERSTSATGTLHDTRLAVDHSFGQANIAANFGDAFRLGYPRSVHSQRGHNRRENGGGPVLKNLLPHARSSSNK